MGIIRKIYFLFLIVILCGCSDFHTADINLHDVPLKGLYISNSEAYYLGEDRVLYCTGADSDASSYVLYQEPKEGIVARDVVHFESVATGGAYINSKNQLYFYNLHVYPSYNYRKKKTHALLLENVKDVAFSSGYFVCVNLDDDLFLVGEFGDETYNIHSPKKLASNVKIITVGYGSIIWVDNEGTVQGYGDIKETDLDLLNDHFKHTNITHIEKTSYFTVIVSDQKLWFYGDINYLKTGEGNRDKKELHLLKDNIQMISCYERTILALDVEGNTYLWGRCISNGKEDTSNDLFEYYNGLHVFSDSKSICTCDGSIGFIDFDGASNIFYSSGWEDFYGNSTNDKVVGIKREPCTWVE